MGGLRPYEKSWVDWWPDLEVEGKILKVQLEHVSYHQRRHSVLASMSQILEYSQQGEGLPCFQNQWDGKEAEERCRSYCILLSSLNWEGIWVGQK